MFLSTCVSLSCHSAFVSAVTSDPDMPQALYTWLTESFVCACVFVYAVGSVTTRLDVGVRRLFRAVLVDFCVHSLKIHFSPKKCVFMDCFKK